MGTVIQYQAQGNEDRYQRWDRIERADAVCSGMAICKPRASPSVKRPRCLRCPAARCRPGERTTSASMRVRLSWRFFTVLPGLAFLHRLVVALHLVSTEVGACGIRLVCLFLRITGLDRFVGASYGTQHQVNRRVEEAIVAYRQRGECAPRARDASQRHHGGAG